LFEDTVVSPSGLDLSNRPVVSPDVVPDGFTVFPSFSNEFAAEVIVINKGLDETVLIDPDLARALVEIVIDVAGLELIVP
jgi:hypothetical protein